MHKQISIYISIHSFIITYIYFLYFFNHSNIRSRFRSCNRSYNLALPFNIHARQIVGNSFLSRLPSSSSSAFYFYSFPSFSPPHSLLRPYCYSSFALCRFSRRLRSSLFRQMAFYVCFESRVLVAPPFNKRS